MKKILRRALFVILAPVVLIVSPVAAHLLLTWWSDPCDEAPSPETGRADVSRFTTAAPAEIVTLPKEVAAAEEKLMMLIRRAAAENKRIAIAGAKHSMGGHTMADGAIVVDITGLNDIQIDARSKTMTVGAGAKWSQIVPELQRAGLAAKVMQSNNDFTVGGSLSVNCHGWQQGLPPISSTVRSIRVVTAAAEVVECTRDNEHRELFRHVLGGYGLFGIITQAVLDVVEDKHYSTERIAVTPGEYLHTFTEMTKDAAVGMAYGRINVAPLRFLETSTVNVLRESPSSEPKTIPSGALETLKRVVFRGTVGSSFGKQIREWGESLSGETSGGWRSVIQSEPASKFGSHETTSSEILHEYFVPVEKLADFLKHIRPHFKNHTVDLLNITVRDVQEDCITALPYARQHVFGLVMLFHLPLGKSSDETMQSFTQAMIDSALAVGGTYYLPYRLHARPDQFKRAYPSARAFFTAKARFDPKGRFANQFYDRYAPEVAAPTPGQP